MKKTLVIGLLIVAMLIVGCNGTQTAAPTEPAATGEGATMKVPAPGNEDVEEMVVESDHEDAEEHDVSESVKEFDIIAKQWEFVPNIIIVNLGDKVELHVESVDVTHGFNLPDFGISERLEPNEDVHINFVADKKGTFSFACHVPCGRGHGAMTGTLIVE